MAGMTDKQSWTDIEGVPPVEEIMRRELELRGVLWPRPIPVAERLPDHLQWVLYFSNGFWGTGYRAFETTGVISPWVDGDLHEITHWLPMPPKP